MTLKWFVKMTMLMMVGWLIYLQRSQTESTRGEGIQRRKSAGYRYITNVIYGISLVRLLFSFDG